MQINTNGLTVGCVLVATTLLAGCKHPLAIQGQGDIVDANQSGRGCTLEQFQAQDAACTDNEVSGDYVVNYRAQPRSGWRFVRWEGPCAPSSDFQHCRIEVPSEAVAAWDENYSDVEILPSTAVFQPVTGRTGSLAGPTVAGAAYSTPTHQGMTGLDGSFQYEEGESVRFMIGDTLLGEATGKSTITPFDLAGSPVLKGREITLAMEGEDRGFPYRMTLYPRGQEQAQPFHIATNIAVLLQSLDHDASAANGIMIRPGVAALLSQVRLNVRQGWEEFSGSLEFQHLLARANHHKRFSNPHGAINPAIALQNLYDSLGIDAKLVGVTQEEWNEHGEYPYDYTTKSYYDQTGHRARRERFADDGSLETMDIWAYDDLGNMTSHEIQHYDEAYTETRQYDTRGNLIQETGSGNPGEIVRYTYDDHDNVTRKEQDENGDGSPETVDIWSYQYDAAGNPIQELKDNLNDGELDKITNSQYDGSGRLLRSEVLIDFNDNGTLEIIYSVDHHYDEAGNTILEAYFWGKKRSPERSLHYSYDVEGNIIREALDSDSDGSLEQITRFAYDDQGGLIREESDGDADGTVDEIQTWKNQYEHDAKGKLTRKVADKYGDGIPNEITRYTYHPNDEVAQEERWEQSVYREIFRRQYDAQGRLTRESDGQNVTTYHYNNRGYLIRTEDREDTYGILERVETWQYDERGYPTHRVSDLDEVETWQYDDDGRLVSYTRNGDTPYPWSADMVATLEYDTADQLVRREEALDVNSDGATDGTRLWQFDSSGNLTRYEKRGESEDWGYGYEPEQVINYTYDAADRLAREAINYLREDSPRETVLYEYDAQGNLIKRTQDQGADGSLEGIDTWEYNSLGKLTRHREYRGEQTDIGTWEYDNMGNLVRHSGDNGADGYQDYIETLEYDPNGHLLNSVNDEIIYENTVSRQYEQTAWGHISHPNPD